LQIDPDQTYVNYVNSDWKQNESGDYIVRQAFLEMDRPQSTPLRILRATGIFGRRGDRFLLIERVYKTDCAYHGGSYVLLDTERRTFSPVGTMGGVPGEVFRHTDGFGFAIGHADLRDLRSAVFDGMSVERSSFPKNARDAPTDYLDAWNMQMPALPRGGHVPAAPPPNCSIATPAERAVVEQRIGAEPEDDVLHCNLARGVAHIARTGLAVLDDEGAVVATHRFESAGEHPVRVQAVGLGAAEPQVEVRMLVETRSKSGTVQVFRVHDGGFEALAEDTALALRPPHGCRGSGSFDTVRARPGSENDVDQEGD
jgi:hypothetical protein